MKKNNLDFLLIGGNWDDEGGKPSGLVRKIFTHMSLEHKTVTIFNGGFYNKLEEHIMLAKHYDVVFWLANVPNDKEKIRDVKKINPRTLLVSSKRNNGEYTFAEMMNRALGQKANLLIEFSNTDGLVNGALYDPLGNCWCDTTTDFDLLIDRAIERINFLYNITRKPTVEAGGDVPTMPNESEFFNLVKEYADDFHRLILPERGVERFLGNASFRCERGFPSFRAGDTIFVSRRNIDKRFIGPDGFVPTKLEDGIVKYWGEHKPSVDTPIQLRLYDIYKNINYMVHAHVYVKDGVYTKNSIPCGAIEEVKEITNIVTDTELNFFTVNLIGHGCLIFANNISQFNDVEFIERKIPEFI